MLRLITPAILVAFGALVALDIPGFAYSAFDGQPSAVPTAAPMPAWTPDARSNVDSLIGWPSGERVVAERKWEDQFVTYPSAETALDIERHLSSVPHRAGTQADYQTALYFRDRLKADGFDVRLEPFQVMFTGPVEQRLALVSPQAKELDLLEGVPGNHSEWEKMAGPAFMQNSADGDVTTPVFYLNAGSLEDWKAFDEMHVTMPPGSIVIQHLAGGFGGGPRDPRDGVKTWEQLVKHKVGGIIQYHDPRGDGFVKGEVWPKGNWKNEYMAERYGGPSPRFGAIAPPGDPTLPGQAPLVGKKHIDWLQAVPVDIPEMSVTQYVARQILASLDGPVVPDGWHDGFEMVEHVGGTATVHMAVKMERKLVTIWNVIGTLRGATQPDEIVTIGGHRDAMTFGAIDPGSGSAVMLQIADGFKKLTDAGWRPDRTIQIKSWDGHELGLWGSISEAYKDGASMRAHIVEYINTDQMTNGPPFTAIMSPELWAFGREIAGYIKAPDGKPIAAATLDPKRQVFRGPGGGSDHVTFTYWLGIPSSMIGYYGHFGAHHTAEDNIDGIRTYDPGFLEAVALAQYTGVQAMRAAGAVRMPLRFTDVAAQLSRDVEAAKKEPQFSGVDFKAFADQVAALKTAAVAFDAKLQAAERSGDVAVLDALAVKAMHARDVFWMPQGLYYNKYWHTIDRFQGAFPEVNFAAYESEGREAKVKAALQRLIDAVDRAIAAIS